MDVLSGDERLINRERILKRKTKPIRQRDVLKAGRRRPPEVRDLCAESATTTDMGQKAVALNRGVLKSGSVANDGLRVNGRSMGGDVMLEAAQLEQHRSVLTGHCYRMMGSVVDADDAVQETMVRAWRSIDRFDGRSSLRTWLYRIATNVCLDMLAEPTRRIRPLETGPEGTADDSLNVLPRTHWLEPVPDARVLPSDSDPSEVAVLRQSIRLAFVAALQHLPPKQRAVLLLTEVLGWSAAEVADSLDASVASVNSALQRARATLESRNVSTTGGGEPLSETQTKLVDRYVDAFLRYDVDALVKLLRNDATLSMPPYTLWLRGHEQIAKWLNGRGSGCRGSRLIPTAACGLPAFGQYRVAPEGGFKPWALIVLELSGDGISAVNSFLDTETLFPKFGMPANLAK